MSTGLHDPMAPVMADVQKLPLRERDAARAAWLRAHGISYEGGAAGIKRAWTKSETKGEATLSESESAPHMWRKTRVALMALSQAALLGWLARVRMSMQSMCSPGSWATLIVLRSAGHGAGNKNPMPVRLFRAKRYPSPCHETPVAMQIQMEA